MGMSSLRLFNQTDPALVLITQSTLSAVSTSLSVNNCFTSAYTNYKIMFSTDHGGGGSGDYKIKMRAGGSDDSQSLYYYYYISANYDSTHTSVGAIMQSGGAVILPADTAMQSVVSIDLYNPALAKYTTGVYTFFSSVLKAGSGGFEHTLTTAFDGFTLLIPTGTATGSLCVYGYKKA